MEPSSYGLAPGRDGPGALKTLLDSPSIRLREPKLQSAHRMRRVAVNVGFSAAARASAGFQL